MAKSASDEKLSILRGLNPVQKDAVVYTDGPSLILAGAGSGKTRVLTHKIAYLIERKRVHPASILALTFTNKAAGEMKHRIGQLVKKQSGFLWCSTFHSCFARMLRSEGEKLGFKTNFAIYDESDQINLIKTVQKDLKIDAEKITSRSVRWKIGQLKSKFITPEEFSESVVNAFDEHVALIYPEYQNYLKQNNAMDFDDLLIMPIELFHSFPQTLEYYQNRWQYILVDEYQDTNYPQYILLRLLSATHRNLSVVGDDDQSIYRWRGANIKNILNFEKDFPDCKVFRLEQNYRSTGNILAVANSVIANNISRMEKELWTKEEAGELVTLLESSSGDEEAFRIVASMQDEFQRHKRNFSDFAILYRTNAQSRALEDGLRLSGIAYIIVGGTRFFERKEIKDVLAYLRVVCNPQDSISLKRIINYPLRGIGNTSIGKIEEYCLNEKIPLMDGIKNVQDIGSIGSGIRNKISNFYKMISKYIKLKDEFSAFELASSLVEELGVLVMLKEEGTEESLSRRENIMELLTQIKQFADGAEDESLAHFLEEVSLVTDIDNWNDKANAVTLMTLHAAKGLEFPVVYIAGLEEGLMPLSRNSLDTDELEEERRLFYVGATRAMEKLYVSYAMHRMRYGETFIGKRSRFIDEIRDDLIDSDGRLDHPVRMVRSRVMTPRVTRSPRPKPAEKKLRRGAFIKHPQFGKGVVRELEGDGENQKATIIFEEVGEKKIVLKYARLEIL